MFTVLSWNLQRLTTTSSRFPDVENVIKLYQPDLVFLAEVSHDMCFFDYIDIGHTLSLFNSKVMGTDNKPSQLSTKLLQHKNARPKLKILGARVLREGTDQPRAVMKVTVEHGLHRYTFRFVHSKAQHKSAGGALAGIKAVMAREQRSAVVGDMNYAINKAADRAAAAQLGQQIVEMKDEFGISEPNTHSAGKILDYMVATPDMKVRALKAKVDTLRYRRYSKRGTGPTVHLSDHRPIVYEVR